MWMKIAQAASERSTCFRGAAGAIIVQDNRDIVGLGYNGPPPGEDHCYGNSCILTKEGHCARSIHAEINALDRANINQATSYNLTMYSTRFPCGDCVNRLIVSAIRISELYFTEDYHGKLKGLDILEEKRIKCFRITASGYIINSEGEITNVQQIIP